MCVWERDRLTLKLFGSRDIEYYAVFCSREQKYLVLKLVYISGCHNHIGPFSCAKDALNHMIFT